MVVEVGVLLLVTGKLNAAQGGLYKIYSNTGSTHSQDIQFGIGSSFALSFHSVFFGMLWFWGQFLSCIIDFYWGALTQFSTITTSSRDRLLLLLLLLLAPTPPHFKGCLVLTGSCRYCCSRAMPKLLLPRHDDDVD